MNNTLFSVSIYDDNKIIGYGRIIGDKTIFLYIQDIMVILEYQGQKVGTKIMNELLTKVDEYKKVNPNIRTYLVPLKEKKNFMKNLDLKLGQVLI